MNRGQLEVWLDEMLIAHREGSHVHDGLIRGAMDAATELRRQWGQVGDLRSRASFSSKAARPVEQEHWENMPLGETSCGCRYCLAHIEREKERISKEAPTKSAAAEKGVTP
jgi:hypothetical protein